MPVILVQYHPEWGPHWPVMYTNVFSYSVTEAGVLTMNMVWGQTIPILLSRVRTWSARDMPMAVQ